MIERSNRKLKQSLKINVASDAPHWDEYVTLAVMAHNTTYHQTLKCAPSELYHGCVLYNALDLKLRHPLQPPHGTRDIKTTSDQVNRKYKANVVNIFSAFFKYKEYYDRKAQASFGKIGYYVSPLNSKYINQSDKAQF